MKPDVFTFTSVISALSKSREASAAEKAMEYLNFMKQVECKPNVFTYSAVISTWQSSKESDAFNKAYALMMEMRELAKQGDNELAPNARTYGALLKVLASSRLPDKAEKAEKIFQEMIGDSLEPSIHDYNDVLHSCTFVHGNDEQRANAFRVAVETFDKIHKSKHLQPNLLTYTTFLQACGNVKGDEQSSAVEEAYQRCCDQGLGDHTRIKRTIEKFCR